jgi:hypothetical protein
MCSFLSWVLCTVKACAWGAAIVRRATVRFACNTARTRSSLCTRWVIARRLAQRCDRPGIPARVPGRRGWAAPKEPLGVLGQVCSREAVLLGISRVVDHGNRRLDAGQHGCQRVALLADEGTPLGI